MILGICLVGIKRFKLINKTIEDIGALKYLLKTKENVCSKDMEIVRF